MTGEALLHQERLVNELAIGLALDCALTRLARDPSAFKTTVEPTQDGKGYRLLLDAPGRAKIFTGTMLAFTSWAYMHDVRYRRSEIVVDAATHRPLEEKDYDHSGKLVAAYTFSDYLEDPAGAAPGRIQALVPYEKDGADHSLEMDARFAFVRPGVWLMQRCHSEFRGGQGGSTGTITVLPPTVESFAPVRELRARLATTRKMIAQANAAPAGRAVIPFKIGQAIPAWTKAAWTETSGTPEGSTVIAVKEAEIERPSSGTYRLTLKLLSTAYWTEYKTRVTAELRDSSGVLLTETAVTVPVRAEGTPALVEAACDFPALAKEGGVSALPQQIVITATVERMTASYHGHGRWMTFLDPARGDDNTASADGKRAWGPEQATGEPDTFQAGDIRTAWASLTPDDQKEWLLLEYAEAVVPAVVKIYETHNPGAVHKVTVFAPDGSEIPVWSGDDPTPPDKPMGVSEIPIKTNVKTNRVKVYIDSPSVPGWNEIDAVGLVDGTGKTHWAVTVTASSTYAQRGR